MNQPKRFESIEELGNFVAQELERLYPRHWAVILSFKRPDGDGSHAIAGSWPLIERAALAAIDQVREAVRIRDEAGEN
jgi:hypothetical protein